MITPSDVSDDELLLAGLAARKLAKLLAGMLSVGLSSLHFDPPESFLCGRDRLILAFVEILRHVGVRPGSESAIALGEHTIRLSRLVDDFFRHLLALAHWRSLTAGELALTADRLGVAYSAALTSLQELLRGLGCPADYSQERMKGQVLINGNAADFSRRL
jgi:hypothetical protein